MEKEASDDSYCTTDEGGNDDPQEEEKIDETIPEKVGDIVKVKEDNIIKEIKQIGTSFDKPVEIDDVIITSNCFYLDAQGAEIQIPKLCEFNNEEMNLSDDRLPRSFALAIQSMRIGEVAQIKIKMKYIFKHINKFKTKYENDIPALLYDSTFQKANENNKLICNITLNNFYIIQNLMDKGEIRKKILKKGTGGFLYAKNSDIVTYDLRCVYQNKELYNRVNKTSELDKELNKTMYEIEHRILLNVKIGEECEVRVLPSYMSYKNTAFLSKYELDNKEPIFFYCKVYDIVHFDYVYNVTKDKNSKKRILSVGFGRDTPDREMKVKAKIMIKIDKKVVYNNFETENIDKYIQGPYRDELMAWRDEKNKENNIVNIDDEIDYIVNEKIYKDLSIKNLQDIDLKQYSIPNLFRKVLIHMKRNEILYIKTTYLDYFHLDQCELYNCGKVNSEEGPLIEIYIHLYEFMHRPMFSRSSYEDKLNEMTKYKLIADDCFKNGKIYRAMKIYQNINYRYNEGDIFGHDARGAQEALHEKDPALLEKLFALRVASHNNYAVCKLKLGKTLRSYSTSLRVIKDFEPNNPKALYINGKCCIMLKYFVEGVEVLTKLNQLVPNNAEFMQLLKEAQELLTNDQNKTKNMYKKMFQHAD